MSFSKLEIISNLVRTCATIGIFVAMTYRAWIDSQRLKMKKDKQNKYSKKETK